MALLDAFRAFFTPPAAAVPGVPFGSFVGEERALTFEKVWGSDSGWQSGNTIAGVHVSTETAMHASAVWACVRLISGAIAGLPLHAFRDEADQRKEIRLPDWIREPIPENPNITRAVHVQQVVTSMLLDGNAFVLIRRDDFSTPTGLQVLDPSRVEIRGTPTDTTYRVQGLPEALTPASIIHIPYQVLPGKLRGLNPIDAARESIGLTLAADQYASAFFGNGATLSGVIEGPQGVEFDDPQIEDMRKSFTKRHVGARKSYAVGMLTGGAKWVPSQGNNRDSQLNELREYQVEDVGRLYGVPPHMIGSQKPGAVAYASVEQRNIDFVTHGLQPVIEKIEDGYERMLRGQRTFFKFNVDGLLRGDAKSRWEAYGVALDKKVMKREEVRAKEDLPNIGELGFLETPNNNPPEEPTMAPVTNNSWQLPESVVVRSEPAVVNFTPPPPAEVHVDVAAPEVHVDAPVVNIAPPEVHVAAPEVTVAAADLSPIETVMAEQLVAFRALAPTATRKVVRRDKQGRITEVLEEPV